MSPVAIVQLPTFLFEKCANVISLRHFECALEHIALYLAWFRRVPDASQAIRLVFEPLPLIYEPVILDESAMPLPEAFTPPALIDCTRVPLHENAIAVGQEGDLRKLPRVHAVHEIHIHFE
jgi:hypothetical protein